MMSSTAVVQASTAVSEKEDAERLAQELTAKGQKLADDKKVRENCGWLRR